MPAAPPSKPIAFRLPAKEAKLLAKVQEETGLDVRAVFTLGLHKIAKDLGLKKPDDSIAGAISGGTQTGIRGAKQAPQRSARRPS